MLWGVSMGPGAEVASTPSQAEGAGLKMWEKLEPKAKFEVHRTHGRVLPGHCLEHGLCHPEQLGFCPYLSSVGSNLKTQHIESWGGVKPHCVGILYRVSQLAHPCPAIHCP